MNFSRWALLLVLLATVSCVPNRKYVYLQKDDLHKKNIKKDTVLRTYDLTIEEYRIQPLDILSIRLESLTDAEFDFMSQLYPQQNAGGVGGQNLLIQGFLVDNTGEIEFPVVGKLKFAGKTVFQVQEDLQTAFKPFLKDPVARVRLLNFRFTILGEVNAEGLVVSNNMRVTLLEAIGLAGGLGELADRSNVKVIRQNEAKSEIFYVNLLEEELLDNQRYYVQQNDVIVVPPLRQRPFRKYVAQNLSLVLSTVSVILLVLNLTN